MRPLIWIPLLALSLACGGRQAADSDPADEPESVSAHARGGLWGHGRRRLRRGGVLQLPRVGPMRGCGRAGRLRRDSDGVHARDATRVRLRRPHVSKRLPGALGRGFRARRRVVRVTRDDRLVPKQGRRGLRATHVSAWDAAASSAARRAIPSRRSCVVQPRTCLLPRRDLRAQRRRAMRIPADRRAGGLPRQPPGRAIASAPPTLTSPRPAWVGIGARHAPDPGPFLAEDERAWVTARMLRRLVARALHEPLLGALHRLGEQGDELGIAAHRVVTSFLPGNPKAHRGADPHASRYRGAPGRRRSSAGGAGDLRSGPQCRPARLVPSRRRRSPRPSPRAQRSRA